MSSAALSQPIVTVNEPSPEPESSASAALSPDLRPVPADRRRGAPPPERRGPRGWFGFFVGLTLLILAAGGVAWMLLIRPAQMAVGTLKSTVAGALQAITGQQVSIRSNTVVVEKSNIAELNVVQRKTQSVLKFESSVLGSSNTLILKGDFVVKAGFDLTKPFKIDVDEATGEVRADFPPARITSVELKNYEVFFSNNGLFNRVTPEHQEMATQQMIQQARLEAERSDMKAEAEAQLQQRLKDLLGGQAKKILLRDQEVKP